MTVATDLFGEPIPEVPKEQREEEVWKKLDELHQVQSGLAPDLGEVLEAMESLMEAYSAWLD